MGKWPLAEDQPNSVSELVQYKVNSTIDSIV